MDKDVRDRYYRTVGTLEALEKAATHATCMPEDVATFALLDAIRGLQARPC